MKKSISLAILALTTSIAAAADLAPIKHPAAVGGSNGAAQPFTPGIGQKPPLRPDITEGKHGIIIGGEFGGAGGKFIPWGGGADLSDVKPLPGTIAQGSCAFNATYVEVNNGPVATTPAYTNRLRANGAVVANTPGLHLNAGESKSITTSIYLPQGSHALTLALDDGNAVTESNEGNNQFSIKYSLKCKSGEGQGKADLVPSLPNPMNGTLIVKNIGTGAAGPSLLMANCQKVVAATAGNGSGCAEVPAEYKPVYADPALPGKFVVKVPALAAGASFSHTVPFWGAMIWSKGQYQFTATADAAHTVAETNEMNNTATSTLSVP
jgi:hypothetical protein